MDRGEKKEPPKSCYEKMREGKWYVDDGRQFAVALAACVFVQALMIILKVCIVDIGFGLDPSADNLPWPLMLLPTPLFSLTYAVFYTIVYVLMGKQGWDPDPSSCPCCVSRPLVGFGTAISYGFFAASTVLVCCLHWEVSPIIFGPAVAFSFVLPVILFVIYMACQNCKCPKKSSYRLVE
jgi:hypothetical protein